MLTSLLSPACHGFDLSKSMARRWPGPGLPSS
jgi:hypothetical protein